MSSSDRPTAVLWRELHRWRGVLLVAVIASASVWLAVTERLQLYIHPRYVVFTVVMAVVALVFCVARAVLLGRGADDDHDDHDDDGPRSARQRVISVLVLAVSGALALAIVVLPPATLSSATALQRDITDSSAALDGVNVDADAGAAATAGYTVREWAALLQQSDDPAFFGGKPVDVTGFVTADPERDDVFYVSRFVISCCAVDAQPLGVPVLFPGWRDTIAPDDWVRVTGEFAAAPDGLALAPGEVVAVDEPDQPYLF